MMSSIFKRTIRSYALRKRRVTVTQQQALENLAVRYCIVAEKTLLEFEKVFGRSAPCILEIGFGMGDSLLQQAQQHPGQNFLGIEVHEPGIGALLAGIEEKQLTNMRVIRADAVIVLQNCIPDNSLDRVQLFFPDPWPKRRHHKRRIVQPAFAELIKQKLKPGGIFHMATDWQDYAKHMLRVLTSSEGFVNLAGVGQYSPRPAERPLTKFEKRGEKLGHGVWDLIFEK